MSSILNTAMSGINSMRVIIENTMNKMNHINSKKLEKSVLLDNTVAPPYLNTALKIKEIYDNYNDFILEEKRKTAAQVHDEDTSIEQMLKLEDLLCNKSNIFNELINELYKQIETDIVVNKENIINDKIQEKLNKVMFALQDFDRRLKSLEKDLKEAIINNVQEVNSLIDQIQRVNIDIQFFPRYEISNQLNDLVNKRDDLVDELNNLVGIRVVKDRGNYQVYLHDGICLIDNDKKQNLMPLTATSDENYISVGYFNQDNHQILKIEDMISTSSLGALLRFKREGLQDTKNKIGQLTVNFADSINAYHTLGYDMFGHVGKQIFNISNPEIISSSTNHSFPKVSSKWISASNAKSTNYLIYFKDGNWTATRLSDHTLVQAEVREELNKTIITFDGIEFTVSGEYSDGDLYMVKPYSKTLEELELLICQNTLFAFSSIDDRENSNRNNAIIINKFNQDKLVEYSDTLDESYQKFSKSIAHKCNALEEEVPFKRQMVAILRDKVISISDNIDRNYQDLNFEQDCYLAHVKILQVAESIFNEIIDCYS